MNMRWSEKKNPNLFPEKRPEGSTVEGTYTPEGLGLALKLIEEKDKEIRAQLAATTKEPATVDQNQKSTGAKTPEHFKKVKAAARKTAGSARLDLRLLLAAAISAAGILVSTDAIHPQKRAEQTDKVAEREQAVLAFLRAAAEHAAVLDDERGVQPVESANIEAAVKAALHDGSGPLRVTEKFGRNDYLVDFQASGIRNALEHLAEVSKFPPRPPAPKDLERIVRLMRDAQSAGRPLSFSFVDATGVWEVSGEEKPPANAPDWEILEQTLRGIIASLGQELNLNQIDAFCADVRHQTGLAIRYRPFRWPDRSRI